MPLVVNHMSRLIYVGFCITAACKYLKSIEVQVSVNDFGKGTNQPENIELHKEQLDKLKVS